MDLTLNVTSTHNHGRNDKSKKSSNSKKSSKNNANDDFAFKFTSTDKIKAIVARKRPIKTISDDTKDNVNQKSNLVPSLSRTNFETNKNITNKNVISSFEKSGNVGTLKPKEIPRNIYAPITQKKSVKNSVEMEKPISESFKNDSEISLNVFSGTPEISLNVVSERPETIKSIFDPARQRRINALKDRIDQPDSGGGYQNNSNVNVKRYKRGEQQNNTKNAYALFGKNPDIPLMGQRFVKPIYEKVFTGVPMSAIGLHPHTVKNIKDLLNIDELTTVQQRAIPVILENKDVLVRSQTGSGKTLAYALPIVHQLQEIRPKLTRDCGVQALVVVPTRELAMQSYELFIKLLKPFSWIVPGYLSGGEKRKSEKARLRKGINILVGTPGRLCDHLLKTESFKLDNVKWLVLDEADRLFELGYEKDVSRIVDALNGKLVTHAQEQYARNALNMNKHKKFDEDEDSNEHTNKSQEIKSQQSKVLQSILLSATLTSAVEQLAGLTLKNPMFIDTADENIDTVKVSIDDAFKDTNEQLVIPSTVELNYMIVPPKLRLVVLSGFIAQECQSKLNKILVFMETQESIDFHHDLMVETLTMRILDEEDEKDDYNEADLEDGLLKGVRFFKLHGSMTQQDRIGVFNSFRSAKAGVLLTTDVAARGLDVPEVDLVIQYTPPQRISDFVHRVGRTARAGRSGRAVMLISPNETEYIRLLEDKRIRISQIDMQLSLDAIKATTEHARNSQEAASNLQHKFESLIEEDKEMHDKACKAFVSWVRYYSAFPKEIKHIFNVRNTHMGHFAKSFGLKEPPKSFAKHHTTLKDAQPQNRLSYKNRDEEKAGNKRYRQTSSKIHKKNPRTICLTTSEFDSGLKPSKMRKQ